IHTLSDALQIIEAVPQHIALGVNPDTYHILEGADPFDALSLSADRLFHVHVCAPDRHYPSLARPAEDNDLYRAFFRALDAAGYRGTLSIEGIATDMRAELPEALSILRAAMQDA
ncbi:MAG: sugar phosphate isomerase/epimerase, partial [Clostridia bacterium]|nr:sugar phosphate isomerase/epimerase [Clostridia bacterium]